MPAMCEGSRAAAMLSWSTQGALQRQDPSHCGVRRYQLGLPVRPETRSAVLIRVYSDQPSFHTPSHTGCLTSPLTRLSRTPPHKMCTHLTQLCHTPNHTGCFDFPSYPLCHAPNHTGCVQLPPSYPTLPRTQPHKMCTPLTQLCHTPHHTGCSTSPLTQRCHAPNHTGCSPPPPQHCQTGLTRTVCIHCTWSYNW